MPRLPTLLCALVLFLISLAPIGRTVAESFLVREAPGAPAEVSLEHYDRLFLAQAELPSTADVPAPVRSPTRRWRLLGNSVAIGLVSALLAVLIGVPLALLVTRTDLPGREWIGHASLAPLVLPPLLVGMAWNVVLPAPESTKGAGAWGDWGGVVAILRAGSLFALCYFPLVFLFARRAFRRVPAALEESARMVGGPLVAVRRVTLPLAAPGILVGALFVFLFALNDFSLIDLLNWLRPVSDRVTVYPFEAFTAWSKLNGGAIATALGMPLVVVGVVLLMAVRRLVGHSRETLSGSFRQARPWALGRFRYAAYAFLLALLVTAVGIPVGALLVEAGGLENYSAIWRQVALGESQFVDTALFRTLYLAFGAAIGALPLAYLLGLRAARTGRTGLLTLSILPLALPPTILGAGYLLLLATPELDLRLGGVNPLHAIGGPQLGAIAMLVAKYVPLAALAVWAASLEVGPRMDEAARLAGASPSARVFDVMVPLLRPALVIGFVLVFVFVLREIDTLVLLESSTLLRRIYQLVHYQRDAQVAALAVMLLVLQVVPFVLLWLLFPRDDAADTKASPA